MIRDQTNDGEKRAENDGDNPPLSSPESITIRDNLFLQYSLPIGIHFPWETPFRSLISAKGAKIWEHNENIYKFFAYFLFADYNPLELASHDQQGYFSGSSPQSALSVWMTLSLAIATSLLSSVFSLTMRTSSNPQFTWKDPSLCAISVYTHFSIFQGTTQ